MSFWGYTAATFEGITARWILDVNEVASFRPHLIVTLIADVYDMWWRTESRAAGEAWKGRPTLEQLLLARRFEVAIGDQLALASATNPRHIVLAVGHPCLSRVPCLLA